jgi:fructose-bisphosphate aldolase class II/tagatose 1,6-diphosphate aldolase GatY/KbaY
MPYHDGSELPGLYAAARRGGYGFFASNVTHPDILVGLLRGAERAGADLIVQTGRDSARFYGGGDPAAGIGAFGGYLEALARTADVGVFWNVDHVHLPDESGLLDAVIEDGTASSVMVDASDQPFEENVARVSDAVDRVHAETEMLVEAELGRVAGTEGDRETAPEEAFYTDPERAVEFVERTGCDLLAVSVGTQHGVASGRQLDVRPSVAADVDEALRAAGHEVPLVVHGSSGITDEQVTAFLKAGVRKFNKNTRYQYEYARTAAEFYHEHAGAVLPPEGVADDRAGMFEAADWSPAKEFFHPHVVGDAVRERLADVMVELNELTGAAGRTIHAGG